MAAAVFFFGGPGVEFYSEYPGTLNIEVQPEGDDARMV